MRSQLDEINYIQRHRQGSEICFYKIKWFHVSQERKLKFNYPGEHCLKKGKLVLQEININYEIWLVNGNLFSIEFDMPTSQYLTECPVLVS